MAGGTGKPGFAPSLQMGLERAGLCLSFPIWVVPSHGRGVLLGESLLKKKKKKGKVFVYSARSSSGSQPRTVPANWGEESTILFAYYGPSNAGLTRGCEHSEGWQRNQPTSRR